ncbi:MAG: ATP-grasp domain-containing protein [Anaerolineaceae bacterium]|jgi:D-alanine-D-alanine ligase
MDSDSDDHHQIAIVFNLEEKTTRGDPKDLIALEDTISTTQYLYEAMRTVGYRVVKVAARKSLNTFRQELLRFSPANTFIFNNCDGFKGVNAGSIGVTRVIEELGFKHSGSRPETIELCINKTKTKEKLVPAGIPTPAYQVFEKPEGEVHVPFPAIVKPALEDGSLGIDRESIVTNVVDLMMRVEYVIKHYDEPVLVEEFIPGRELNVAVWGNGVVEALPIDEQEYSKIDNPLEWLLTYESKWIPDSPYYQNITTHCPADLTPAEEQYVKSVAINTFKAIGLRDFARVDMRYLNGVAYVVDVNEIPDLAPTSGFPVTAAAAGYDYQTMVKRLVELGLKREGWL